MPCRSAALAGRILVIRVRLAVGHKQNGVRVDTGLYAPALRTVGITIIARSSVRYEKVLPLLEYAESVVDPNPFAFICGSGHRELRACRVTGLRHVVGRGDLIDIHRMGEARRAKPIARRPEGLLRTAGFAISRISQSGGTYIDRLGKAALATFKIETFRLPCVVSLIAHDGIDRSRSIALPGYPYLLTWRVLGERDGETLRRGKAHDCAKPC